MIVDDKLFGRIGIRYFQYAQNVFSSYQWLCMDKYIPARTLMDLIFLITMWQYSGKFLDVLGNGGKFSDVSGNTVIILSNGGSILTDLRSEATEEVSI